MKTLTIASVIALASVASAQLDLPQCSLNCFINPLQSDGCSSLTDFACHCRKGATLLESVQPCVQAACQPADQNTVTEQVQKICQNAGVPMVFPDASAAAAAAVSSATQAATSDLASIVSSVESLVASVASAESSAASRALSGVASATASALVSSKASTSLSQFTGGAPQATQAASLIGAAAIALLAM